MTEINGNRPNGSPCWLDIGVPDLDAATAFYAATFGWDFDRGDEEGGYYTMAKVGGRFVAALAPGEGPNYFWNPYFASDDIDATTKLVGDAGGSVVAGPFDVLTAGRLAVLKDRSGAQFGLWEGRDMPAFGLVEEPGSLAWLELGTTDTAAARDFYGAVLERPVEPMNEPGFDYWTVQVDGRPVAGIWGDAGAPQQWTPYFAVADTDATVARVTGAGGGVVRPAEDSPYGRFAIVTDPSGAVFAVMKPEQP